MSGINEENMPKLCEIIDVDGSEKVVVAVIRRPVMGEEFTGYYYAVPEENVGLYYKLIAETNINGIHDFFDKIKNISSQCGGSFKNLSLLQQRMIYKNEEHDLGSRTGKICDLGVSKTRFAN